jgi:protein-ribulosamine 3-kinase
MSYTAIDRAISAATGKVFTSTAASPIMGGSINEAMRLDGTLDGNQGTYFVKLNRPALADMFAAEAEGLTELRSSGAVKAPEAICWGENGSQSWLVLEFIESGYQHNWSSGRLGEHLAAMHHHTTETFGWHRDNYIGRTPQPNPESGEWADFYGRQRLTFQLQLAREKGAPGRLTDTGQRLVEGLSFFFTGYSPTPSLLHGDLWGGNWACDVEGKPVIFDPAVYYGDREADIAMTELFGGFDTAFYKSYNACWPLDPGYEKRKTLYNLYHILNHFNLFGGGYASQAQGMVDALLAELA